jgi:hypothetical protein
MYRLTKKSLVILGSIGAILLGSSQPQAIADVEPIVYTQTVKTKNWDIMTKMSAFKRLDAKIVTTRPWLNPENKRFILSDSEITSILKKAGFSGRGLKIAQRIVFLESTNRPYALNKSSNCYGLFQINMTGIMGQDRKEKYGLSKNEDLFDPLINAKIAHHMSNGGQDWSAWTTEKAAKSST